MFGQFVLVCGMGYFAGSYRGHPETTCDRETAARYGYRGVAKQVAERLQNRTGEVWQVVKLETPED